MRHPLTTLREAHINQYRTTIWWRAAVANCLSPKDMAAVSYWHNCHACGRPLIYTSDPDAKPQFYRVATALAKFFCDCRLIVVSCPAHLRKIKNRRRDEARRRNLEPQPNLFPAAKLPEHSQPAQPGQRQRGRLRHGGDACLENCP